MPGLYQTKRSAVHVAEALVTGKRLAPMSAFIHLSDRCNESCVHCFQIQGRKGEMSTDEVKRVLDELAELGVLFLTFSGGEVTLRRDFLEIVRYAREKRFAVKFYTNGLTMTAQLASQLAALAVQEVQISLYSHRAEVHDWVTKVPGSWERTVSGIRNLVAARVYTVAKTPLMTFNVHERDLWLDLVRGLGADYMLDSGTLLEREDGDNTVRAFRVSDAEAVDAARTLAPELLRDTPAEVPLAQRPCGAGVTNLHIQPDGQIRACEDLLRACGHAVRDGVANSLANDPTVQLFRTLTWADQHGCRDCELRSHCHRCYAKALAEGGDMLGPYEAACGRAKAEYGANVGMTLAFRPARVRGGDTTTGPYRIVDPGVLEAVEDALNDRDRELVERFPWLRSGPRRTAPPVVRPGDVIQIRRPGRGTPSVERIPVSATAESATVLPKESTDVGVAPPGRA